MVNSQRLIKENGKRVKYSKGDRYKNVNAPPGKHWCSMHNDGEGAYLTYDKFHKNKNLIHGLADRCKQCMREYRREYEAKYGRRRKKVKSINVPEHVHAEWKKEVQRREQSLEVMTTEAIRFYLQYGCRTGACTNPRTPSGMCERHTALMTIPRSR